MEFSHEQIVKFSLDNNAPWLLLALKDMEDKVRRLPGKENHPRILEYWKNTNYNPKTDEESYCAAGLCTWLEESGYISPRAPAAISFEDLPRVTKFFPGTILLFYRQGSEGWMRHVNIGLSKEGHTYWCLGANQGPKNEVCIRPYDAERLSGMFWPVPKSNRGMR